MTLCAFLGLACAACASAQSAVFDVARAHVGPAQPAALSVNSGDHAQADIAAIAMLGEASWQTFDPKKLYPVSTSKPLWLRLKTRSGHTVTDANWLLEMPTVVVDRYEVYQRDASGAWGVQLAGDRVAHRTWGEVGLKPRFAMTAPSAGEHQVFIKIIHVLPVRMTPVILHRSVSAEHDAKQQLWVGLLLGVILALVLTCAQMSLAYRDRTYAWYAGYLIFTAFTALTYSGIGQRELWPDAAKFAGDALLLGVMMAYSFIVQFSLSMFGAVQHRLFHWVARALVVACLAYLAMLLVQASPERSIYVFYAITGGVFSCVIFGAYTAWRRGIVYGGYWLMVYLPFLGAMGLTMAASSGLIALPWLPEATPVWMAMAEAIGMMLCLNGYSRVRHAQSVQAKVSARHDPLTGFLTHDAFEHGAMHAWHLAASSRRDVVVVHVRVMPAQTDLIGSLDAEALMARSVRLVRSATREFDLVGRIGADQLAFVMADVRPGDGFAGRMQRLVALGLMNDSGDPRDAPVRFRIGVAFYSVCRLDYAGARAALRQLLAADAPAKKAVQYLVADDASGMPSTNRDADEFAMPNFMTTS